MRRITASPQRSGRAATDIHRLLQLLLGLPPVVYHHHHLITDAEGRKLAKRHGAESLRMLRDQGASPADIRRLAGLAPEAVGRRDGSQRHDRSSKG